MVDASEGVGLFGPGGPVTLDGSFVMPRGDTVIDEDTVQAVFSFAFLYPAIFAVSAVVIALDASRVGLELTTIEALSASIATLGNIGPGFGRLGPFGNFLFFPATSKPLVVVLM